MRDHLRHSQNFLKERYQHYQRFIPALSFSGGALWDIFFLGRIDQWSNIIQLGFFLCLCLALLFIELFHINLPSPSLVNRLWKFRLEIAHFCYGSLLSAFSIFFFKSTSFLKSLFLSIPIGALLIANEFTLFRRLGLVLRTSLFAICYTSYLACVLPLVDKKIDQLQFFSAIGLSAFTALILFLGQYFYDKTFIKKRMIISYAGVLLLFSCLYLAQLIPPVPAALTHIGIYHDLKKENGHYLVAHSKSSWRFWETGDQTFIAKEGDKIYCFFSVFSPGGFRERLVVRWLFHDDRNGWRETDKLAVHSAGGREQGWRGYTYKANYQAGDWQIRLETADGREIGRIYLNVESSKAPAEPAKYYELF